MLASSAVGAPPVHHRPAAVANAPSTRAQARARASAEPAQTASPMIDTAVTPAEAPTAAATPASASRKRSAATPASSEAKVRHRGPLRDPGWPVGLTGWMVGTAREGGHARGQAVKSEDEAAASSSAGTTRYGRVKKAPQTFTVEASEKKELEIPAVTAAPLRAG